MFQITYRFVIATFVFVMLTTSGSAATKVQFTLDWKFEGPAAPYFLAIDKGFFKSEGLEVEITPGKGSPPQSQKLRLVLFRLGSPTSTH